MTIKEAEVIGKLLENRKILMEELRELDQCKSITGHINDGVNGTGFRWEQGDRQIKYLIEGIKAELARVEETIAKIKLAEGEPNG